MAIVLQNYPNLIKITSNTIWGRLEMSVKSISTHTEGVPPCYVFTDEGNKGESTQRRNLFKRGYYLRKYNNLFCQEPEARCETNECPKCFKDKLYEYGVVDSYRMKFTGSKSVDQCYSLNKCCVCFNLVNQTIQWMDLIVCTVSS